MRIFYLLRYTESISNKKGVDWYENPRIAGKKCTSGQPYNCYLWEFIRWKSKGVFHGSHGDKLWLFFDWGWDDDELISCKSIRISSNEAVSISSWIFGSFCNFIATIEPIVQRWNRHCTVVDNKRLSHLLVRNNFCFLVLILQVFLSNPR